MNDAKQPLSRPSAVRLIPPSTMPPAGIGSPVPLSNLSSNVQAGSVAPVAAMAHRVSLAGVVAQEPPGRHELQAVLPLVDTDDRVCAAVLEVDLDEHVAIDVGAVEGAGRGAAA